MRRIAAGVADYADSTPDVDIVFAGNWYGPKDRTWMVDCDAAIVYAPRTDLSIPQVSVSSTAPADCLRVGVDEAKIADLVVSYFVSMGLRHIAFAGRHDVKISEVRWKHFSVAAYHFGVETSFLDLRSHSDMSKQLEDLPKPCGIVAYNDDIGRYVMQECARTGLRVPGELNIIGVDNLPEPDSESSRLASVSIPFAHMGYQAARLCHQMVEGKTAESVLIQPTGIVLGESLTSPGMEMNTAAAVAHFMRTNIGEAIEMEDLVRQSNLSRRRLEQIFRTAYDMGPMAYLKELRLERAKLLLHRSDDSLKDIVKATGYRDVNHLCRIFRQQLKTTPLKFRNSIGDQ